MITIIQICIIEAYPPYNFALKYMKMKRFLILGAGTAGTMMANKLRKSLSVDEWEITIVDQHKTHYYQPGFLFIPFGIYNKQDVIKPKTDFFPPGVNVVFSEIDRIDGENNQVFLNDSKVLSYDMLIIATGVRTVPEETPGLKDKLWYKNIFDFYTVEGAIALQKFFKSWEGGKLVMAIAEMPFKCPVAPIEFVCLADWYFTQAGIRDKVDISFVTPLPGAFTKPIATKMLSTLLEEKNIKVIPESVGTEILSFPQTFYKNFHKSKKLISEKFVVVILNGQSKGYQKL